MSSDSDFEELVTRYYQPLYQFAYSLTRTEADASDLTQQTFYIWAAKGHQLQDRAKVKTWLFTTLHREFLRAHRQRTRFSHYELDQMENQLPAFWPSVADQLDSTQVLGTLAQVDQIFQAPLTLFYLEDCSYKEIAEILDVPIGTVKSRIARGIERLYQMLNPAPAALLEQQLHE